MGRIKLSKEDVETIKDLVENTTLYHREIAQIFGVSRGHITKIKNKKRWNYDYGEETNTSQKEAIERYFQELRASLH